MKIAHVVATFPPRVGGVGTVAYDECRKLAQRGHEVTVFTLWYPDDYKYDPMPVPFKVVRLVPQLRLGDAGRVPPLKNMLDGFDVVHLHYPWYGGAEFVFKAKQKYVVTYHMDAAPVGIIKKAIQFVYDTLYAKNILSKAEKVVCFDQEQLLHSDFGKIIPAHKIVELPNGIDTDIFCPNDVGADHNQPLQRELVFVGNLMPVKGLDVLLKSLAVIVGVGGRLPVPSTTSIHLTVIGSGYSESYYKKMVDDLALQNHVTFVGSVPSRELPQYYRRAWCTIIPSRAESFSLVALESLACGTPVIVSNIPGARSRVVEGVDGLLVTPGSVDSLVDTITHMINLTTLQRNQVGERGVQKVQEQYGLEKHIATLETIYAHVI